MRSLWAASRKINFDIYNLESKAQDAENRLEKVTSQVEKVTTRTFPIFFSYFIKWMSCGPWCIFVWVASLMLWCIYTMVLKCMEHRDDLWLFSTIKIPIPMYIIPYVIFKVSKIFNEWDGNSCWHGHIIMENCGYLKMILILIAYCL